jgi:hypothetical protein
MKHYIKKGILILTVVIGLLFSGCQNEPVSEALSSDPSASNPVVKSKTVAIKDIPQIDSFIQNTIGKGKSAKNGIANAIFDQYSILQTTTQDNATSYSIRFVFPDTPQTIFYNLVVLSTTANSEKTALVYKYNCETFQYETFKNSGFNFKYFKGSISQYKLDDVFAGIPNKGVTNCPPKFDTNGDPISCIQVNNNGGGSTSGGSTGGGPGNPGSNSTWLSSVLGGGSVYAYSYTASCICQGQLVGAHNHTPDITYVVLMPTRHDNKGASNCPKCQTNSSPTPVNTIGAAIAFLKTELGLSTSQYSWLIGKEQVAIAIINYLVSNNTPEDKVFIKEAISQMIKTGLVIDIQKSSKSPFFIDLSSVLGNTPEEIKFNEVYNALTKSTAFRNLFTSLFGSTPLFNIKFTITDIPETPNGKLNGICYLKTYPNRLDPFNSIEIDRSHLLTNSKVDIANSILHECIHAYLNIKFRNPSIGMSIANINNMDFQTCINTYYNGFSGNQTQHSFYVNFMIPTMVQILKDIKSDIITTAQADLVENPTNGVAFIYQPMGNYPNIEISSVQIPWSWNDFFTHLAFTGLQESTAYPSVYPKESYYNFIKDEYMNAFNVLINHN